MTKADLVARVHERLGSSSKTEVKAAVDSVLAIISKSLKRGEGVKIVGFGSFVVAHKRARRGRNPQTGKPITINARSVLSFRPSDGLKGQLGDRSKSR
jgi:integration host factor subunit alpha